MPCILAFLTSKKYKLWGFSNKIFSLTGNSVKTVHCFVYFKASNMKQLIASAPALQCSTVPSIWSIHHWIDQQKLMALKFLMKSWKIFWFRLYSGHFKQFGKNNLCLLNYFIIKIPFPKRISRKNETYTTGCSKYFLVCL